jgi:hypothetical protein
MAEAQWSTTKFLARPTRNRWQAEVGAGWRGPDGSSMSTDTICGVRIGVTSDRWEDCDLPANRHDWYYRLGRRYRLGKLYRVVADRAYRDMCLQFVRRDLGHWNPLRYVAVGRCHARYAGLRIGAAGAFTKKARRLVKARSVNWNDKRRDERAAA